MIQVTGLPPNYEDIRRVFPSASGPNVIFAYGDIVYVPNGKPLPQEIYDHERVHGQRQTDNAGGVTQWWRRYLEDPVFRQAEELVAHIREYHSFCERNADRNARNGYLSQMAARFAGPLYGLGCSVKEAKRMIVDKL